MAPNCNGEGLEPLPLHEITPSEEIIIEIIKQSNEDVKSIIKHNSQNNNINTKLLFTSNFLRPKDMKSLETMECELKKCHRDSTDHRLEQIQS